MNPLATPSYPTYGNEVSIEFNLIYRWHGAIGREDEDWLTNVMTRLGPVLRDYKQNQNSNSSTTDNNNEKQEEKENKGTDQSTFDSLLPAYNDAFVHADPEELALGLPIADAHRNLSNGSFNDEDLGKILRRAYNQVASEMG